MSWTTYDLVRHPVSEREDLYLGLKQMFDECLSLGTEVLTLNLDPAGPGAGHVAILQDHFVAETTIDGVNAEDSGTINVVSTAGFRNPSASGSWAWLRLAGAPAGSISYTGLTATSFTGCSAHPATVGGERIGGWLVAIVVGANAADSATINVDSTDGWPASGSLKLTAFGGDSIAKEVTYTGKTATSFTGCSSHDAVANGDGIEGPPPWGTDQAASVGLENPYMVTF